MPKRIDPWQQIRGALRPRDSVTPSSTKDCLFANGDARELTRLLPAEAVDCIITSPPYSDLKDYGVSRQMGFGQQWEEEYLKDLERLLGELGRVCRKGGALWIVVDTVKKARRTLLLPWEILERATSVGWCLEDIVIWDKGRSLPWSHVGRFRGVFEYVLLLSKGGLARFELDRVRDTSDLSPYWVRFPERYNPRGKAPSDIWHFPIPVQGSWSSNGIRHFCPFPLAMVARMILLTTPRGGVVLDPFAGTGVVPSVAAFLGRRGLGFDVNGEYVRAFEDSGHEALLKAARIELGGMVGSKKAAPLGDLIVRLRMLKYPMSMFSELVRPDRLGQAAHSTIAAFVVIPRKASNGGSSEQRRQVEGEVEVWLLCHKGADLVKVREQASRVAAVAPLSKFCLRVGLRIVSANKWESSGFAQELSIAKWYSYSGGVFRKFREAFGKAGLCARLAAAGQSGADVRYPIIFSPLRADVPRIE
jgi:DNA modification methylase